MPLYMYIAVLGAFMMLFGLIVLLVLPRKDGIPLRIGIPIIVMFVILLAAYVCLLHCT